MSREGSTVAFTAVVVDDEPLARDELKYLLSAHPECQVVGEAEDARGALKLAAEVQPDVFFLDIEMRGASGYEAARALCELPNPPLIIFATAYQEYAARAFELGAVDYVLKPFAAQRIAKSIERVVALRKRSGDWADAIAHVAALLESKRPRVHKLPVDRRGEIKLLNYDEILYAIARDGGVQVHTLQEPYTFNGPMAELESRLSGAGFLRVHKSYLVNLDRVEGVLPWFKGTYWLVMSDSQRTEIPVSKSLVKELKTVLGIERV
jgi:two-component system response regulator LytT